SIETKQHESQSIPNKFLSKHILSSKVPTNIDPQIFLKFTPLHLHMNRTNRKSPRTESSAGHAQARTEGADFTGSCAAVPDRSSPINPSCSNPSFVRSTDRPAFNYSSINPSSQPHR
uniref:Uncharacterized protein n=1 Tax=Oryza brachyantha TaxID=4533 RepID=J3M4P5_ORYBR